MAKRAGVYGAKNVAAAFRRMAKQSAFVRPVTEAQRYALQPILQAAKQNTAHASIRKALTIKKDSRAPKSIPTMVIGGDPKNPDFRLLHLLEFGVDPHMIGAIHHPGHAAQPFLTPAFEAHGEEAIKRFGERIGPAIEKQAARLSAKGGGK